MPARLALVLAAVLLLAVACGGGSEPQSEPPQVAVAQSSSESAEQAPSVDARDDGQQVAQQAPDRDAQVATQQQAEQSANQSTEPAPRDREQTVEVERGAEEHRFVEALGGRTFEQPIELLAWPDGGLLVAEQRGSLTVYGDDGSVRGVLDLSDRVTFSDERGLLSVAVDPQFAARPFLYIWYSPRGTHVTRLSRFPVAAGLADRDAELVILEVQQPYSNHNGGALRFGPDGMLYLGIGDGGAANDPHENGQNRGTLLGTIIRIDVSAASEQYRYGIPADNPFLGVPGVRPEIFAFGLRNPWRMAFDPDTGALWVGDVGQNRVEEVSIVEAGSNQGWNVFEGDECFGRQSDCDALEHSAPLATYSHELGCSVTGGVVYRGAELPWLVGAYLFADYCSGRVWALQPGERGGSVQQLEQLDAQIASFGVDARGEVYLLTFDGPILRLSRAN